MTSRSSLASSPNSVWDDGRRLVQTNIIMIMQCNNVYCRTNYESSSLCIVFTTITLPLPKQTGKNPVKIYNIYKCILGLKRVPKFHQCGANIIENVYCPLQRVMLRCDGCDGTICRLCHRRILTNQWPWLLYLHNVDNLLPSWTNIYTCLLHYDIMHS